MKPYFSIVIPLYNKEKHIRRAIDSVLAQTIHEYELIIVNDGSTDNSVNIVEDCNDPRIRLINQENAGVSAARNRGIKEATAQYIAFLDADDEWDRLFLEDIAIMIRHFPLAGAYATGCSYKEQDKNIKYNHYTLFPNKNWQGKLENYFEYLSKGIYPISSSSICVKRELFREVGMFDSNLTRGEDTDMWIRLFLNKDIIFSAVPRSIYYLDSENRSNEQKDFNIKSYHFIQKQVKRLLLYEFPSKYFADYKKYINNILLSLAIRFINSKNKKSAFGLLSEYWKIILWKNRLKIGVRLLIPYFLLEIYKQVVVYGLQRKRR